MGNVKTTTIDHVSIFHQPAHVTLQWLGILRRRHILRLRDRFVPWQMRHFYYHHEMETLLSMHISVIAISVMFSHFIILIVCFISKLLGSSLAISPDILPAGAMFTPGFTSLARRISLARSKELYHAGQAAEELMVLVEGYGRLCMEHGDGRCLTVGLVAPGDLFGEETLLDEPERESTFEAVLNCQIDVIAREDFTKLVNNNPLLLRTVMEHLAQRLLTQQRHMALLAFEPLERRLAWILITLATATKTLHMPEPTIPIYHKDLAAMLSVWRETITATMNRWSNEGLVVQHPGQIVLKDIDRLQKLADEASH